MNDSSWPQILRRGVIDAKAMHARGWIDGDTMESSDALRGQLNFRVPQAFAAAIDAGDKSLARQFVPGLSELTQAPEEMVDPIGDEARSPVFGITHRYPDRVLLKPTLHCAVYCRFCFRREKVAKEGLELTGERLESAMAYIASDSRIREVILTGGDPLTLTDARLKQLLERLGAIEHVRLLRIHTRVFTALPERITPELVNLLRTARQTVWTVLHINAPSELTEAAKASIARFADGGLPLLHQGVLLKGVNDTEDRLSDLFCQLIELRVKPYYLHYPDLAKGTSQFRIPLKEALDLMASLRGKLPGYCQPELMIDIPGGKGKVPVAREWLRQQDEAWQIFSPLDGEWHSVRYPNA